MPFTYPIFVINGQEKSFVGVIKKYGTPVRSVSLGEELKIVSTAEAYYKNLRIGKLFNPQPGLPPCCVEVLIK